MLNLRLLSIEGGKKKIISGNFGPTILFAYWRLGHVAHLQTRHPIIREPGLEATSRSPVGLEGYHHPCNTEPSGREIS